MILSRLEFKYLVPLNLLSNIRKAVLNYMRYDPYAEIRETKDYTVRSIYFDTADLMCYNEKYEGYKKRNKYRVRVYNERRAESIAFLEIKRKNENFISKDRAKLLFSNLENVLSSKNIGEYLLTQNNGNDNYLNASKFLFHYYSKQLVSSSLVVYEREAFIGKFGLELRVTFDKNLRGSIKPIYDNIYEESKNRHVFPDSFILEIKFHQTIPAWIPQLINKHRLQRISISKYTNIIDINKRQLPRTKQLDLLRN
ncbi:MAG: polyphosphate polymerase domain-containing protein [Ignavibacteria bacterium]|nr:polyphosphate polymerase domain-containing protein [Ignavibacteria bacterium]